MRLVPKISLALAGAAAASIVAAALWFSASLAPHLQALDRETAVRSGTLIASTVGDGLSKFANANRDWSDWDASYDFMQSLAETYVSENLKLSDLDNIDVDAVAFLNMERTVVFQRAYNHKTGAQEVWFETGKAFPFADWPGFQPDELLGDRTGVVEIGGQPAMMSVTQILTSDKLGPPRGYLVFIRILTAERIDEIEDITQLVLSFTPFAEHASAAYAKEPGTGSTLATEPGDGVTRILVRLSDLAGRPSYVAETSLPRRFFDMGQSILRTVIIGLGGMALLIFVLGIAIMSRLVARPLTALAAHIDKASATDASDSAKPRFANDEIGSVGRKFDAVIASLAESRQLLEEQSYFGGMADVSASVIHNVRNALNPILTEVWRAENALEGVKSDRLLIAGEELSDPACDPVRRMKLAELVVASAALAQESKDAAQDAHDRILNFSSHIDEILAHYDDVSRSARGSEPVLITSIVRSAVEFAASSAVPPISLRISNLLPGEAATLAQRIVLTQVMSNLVSNAADSMRRAGVV